MKLLNKINDYLNEERLITKSINPRQIANDYLKHFNNDHKKAHNALQKKVIENENDNSFFMWVSARDFVKMGMQSEQEKMKREKLKRDKIDYEDDRKFRVKDTIDSVKKHQGR